MPKETHDGTANSSEIAAMKRNAAAQDATYQDAYETGRAEGTETVTTKAKNGRLSFSNDAQKVILIAMTVTVLVSIVENVHAKNKSKTTPISSILVGGFVSGALLLAGSYFLPEFASGLAVVAMTATVLERGKPFWEVITDVTGNSVPNVQYTTDDSKTLSGLNNTKGLGGITKQGEQAVAQGRASTPLRK